MPLSTVSMVLNHSTRKLTDVTGLYVKHDFAAEKAEALQRHEDWLFAGIVQEKLGGRPLAAE